MKFCLGLGLVDKNILYIIVGGLIYFFMTLYLGEIVISNIFDHSLVMNLASSLGLMLSFIPTIIYKIKNKEMKCCKCCKKDLRNNLVYNDYYKNIRCGKYKLIILSSLIDFTQSIIIDAFIKINEIFMFEFELLFISLFSFIIFKSKLYLHHYLSIILIICVNISLDIYLSNFNFDNFDKVISMILKFISEILLSLVFVIDKYIMEKKFSSPYELCFFHGTINFILGLICLSFSREIGLDNYEEFFLNPSFEKFWAFIIIMLSQFIINLFILIINKNTSPCHIIIILIIGQFAPYVRALTIDTKNSIILIIGLSILFFLTLIFNEIIEIKCFGLQKNTKKNIALRAEMDRLSIDNIYSEIDTNGEDEEDNKTINDI